MRHRIWTHPGQNYMGPYSITEYGPAGSIFYREYGPGSIFHGTHILYAPA